MMMFELSDGATTYAFRMPNEPNDLTCGQVMKYQDEIERVFKPETLKQFEAIKEDSERRDFLDGLDEREIETQWTSFYIREIQFFTGMSVKMLSLLPVESNDGFDIFTLRTMLSNALNTDVSDEIEHIKHKGTTYYLPQSPVNLHHPALRDYMRGSTLGEYATAAEIYRAYDKIRNGSVRGLLHVIAILCRKKGEPLPVYPDEQTKFIQERVKVFESLPYGTALDVGFFLFKHSISLKIDLRTLNHLEQQVRQTIQKNTDII